jgi:hypothetical protein
MQKLSAIKQSLQTDLEELKTKIYPRFEDLANDVQTEKARLETNYEKLTTVLDQQGEVWHQQITTIVNQRKSDIAEMKTKHTAALDKNAYEITQSVTELKKIIVNLKSILDSNDISQISAYNSRNDEFRRLPLKVRITLPSFSPQKIDTDRLREMFGSLSSLSINTELDDTMTSAEVVSPSLVKQVLGEPRLIATIDTGCKPLYSVRYLIKDHVWTCGYNETMKLFNFHDKLQRSIKTKSGNIPRDIAVTRDGDLVYTDYNDRTVNLVKNNQIKTVSTFRGWYPLNLCCTTSDDFLVTVISDDKRSSKVVRYSDCREKQSIQLDDQGRPLYSSGYNDKYITENKNQDICVADNGASAVVVVNQQGEFRFRYAGHPSSSIKELFNPHGIATDSQSRILTADSNNHCIHILDQDGEFLCYIQNCNLEYPWGLCMDIGDNLLVAEYWTAKVKKIKY